MWHYLGCETTSLSNPRLKYCTWTTHRGLKNKPVSKNASMGIPTLSLLQNIILMKTCQLMLSQLEAPPPPHVPPSHLHLRTRSPVIASPPSPLQYQNDLHTQHYLILAGLPALQPPAPERTFWELALIIPHMLLMSLPLQSSTGPVPLRADQPALLPDPLPRKAQHRPGTE